MSKEELLAVWRGNLDRINLQIAAKGGDSVAPLDLLNMRKQTEREIEGLVADTDESGKGWLSQASSYAWLRMDYALDVSRLRSELAMWQADVTKGLDDMTDQKVDPVSKLVSDMYNKLDTINSTINALSVQIAVATRDIENIKREASTLAQLTSDVYKIKAFLGINGDSQRKGHIPYGVVIMSVAIVALGIMMVVVTLRAP